MLNYIFKFKRKRKGYYPSNYFLPHSKRKIYREINYYSGSKTIWYQMEDEMFDDYELTVDNFHGDLLLGCNFIEHDEIENQIVNRKIKLNKKAAWMLIKDLLKYIFTGHI